MKLFDRVEIKLCRDAEIKKRIMKLRKKHPVDNIWLLFELRDSLYTDFREHWPLLKLNNIILETERS